VFRWLVVATAVAGGLTFLALVASIESDTHAETCTQDDGRLWCSDFVGDLAGTSFVVLFFVFLALVGATAWEFGRRWWR
jgi:hypothetical protein